MRAWLKKVLPAPARTAIKSMRNAWRRPRGWMLSRMLEFALGRLETRRVVPILAAHDLNVARVSDFYSPLPVAGAVRQNISRWFKPSGLVGVEYDLDQMKTTLRSMVAHYGEEYSSLPNYALHDAEAYGPGFTRLDAMLLYLMIRTLKPRRYIEVGSGLSTYYAWLAATRNAGEGSPVHMSCVDPYPYEKIRSIADVDVLQMEVQDTDLPLFQELGDGDVLFIDSTHVVKIDGDVAFLYLEVIPRLRRGVRIHIHDVQFPYNVPYPPEYYLFGEWPLFRTEPMMLQAFLAHNNDFRIRMSLPLLRFFDEDFLRTTVPGYETPQRDEPRTHFGSIWVERVA